MVSRRKTTRTHVHSAFGSVRGASASSSTEDIHAKGASLTQVLTLLINAERFREAVECQNFIQVKSKHMIVDLIISGK